MYERTLVRRGATIGANATIICGVAIGRYAFIGAGAVVTHDVPDYALMLGVPARQKGWMSRHGHRLHNPSDDGIMICLESGWRYKEVQPGVLRCLDWPEDQLLEDGEGKGEGGGWRMEGGWWKGEGKIEGGIVQTHRGRIILPVRGTIEIVSGGD